MSPTLRGLLIATGVIVSGFGVYLAAPDADADAVKTLALADGFVARAAEAEFRLTPNGVAWLSDAGLAAPKYVRLQFAVAVGVGKESDGGNAVILPALPLDRIHRVQDGAITTTTCAARPGVCVLYGDARPFKIVPHACAWKPTAGAVCTRVNLEDPGVQNTMQPGGWVGVGCVPKSCVEIAGESSEP